MALLLGGLWVLLGGGSAGMQAAAAPHAWQRWEQKRTSTRPYDNPSERADGNVVCAAERAVA